MFKLAVKISLLLISLSLIGVSTAIAQNTTIGELRNMLARFDTELEKARELIRSFDNRQAQALLMEAENLRNQAAEIINKQNPRPAELVEAGLKLRAASAKLAQAVKLALDGTIKRWRSKLEQLLQRADQEVISTNHQEAIRLLQLAKQNREAAEQALVNGNGFKALEHLRVAVNLVEQALDMSSRNKVDAFVEERRRFEMLRERAREVVEKSSDPRARIIFNQANKMAESALQAEQNRNAQLSRKFYNQAILLLLRAMDLAKGQTPDTVNQVSAAIYRLRELIDSSKNLLQNAPARVHLILERAQRFATEAELAAKEGRSHEALWKIELAENLVNRARRMPDSLGGKKFASRIAEEIENTKLDIAEVRSDLALEPSPDAEILINMAEVAISKAEQAASVGMDRFALEAVLAAQRFLTKAERILNNQDSNGLTQERVQARLTQLDEAIIEAESRIDLAKEEWARRLLLSAKEFRQLAAESLQKGNYRAADEAIQVAFDLLRKSLKNVPNN